jgi:hypothetical protein
MQQQKKHMREPHEKADAVKATAPEFNPEQTKLGENDAATEASAPEAKTTASDEGATPVKATAAELNPNPTKSTENNAVTDATSPKAKERGPDSIPTDVTTNDNGTSASLGGVLNGPTPDKMVEDSEAMATAPDSIPTDIATKDNGILASQGTVSQPPSVDQMVQDLKQKIAVAEENKSLNAPAEVSVEPAMVSLSALSAMWPSPGLKAEKYRPAAQYTSSPGPTPDKNRATTRSTPSPDPKKKKSPLAAGADESLMHSGRNFDALVGMDSLTKGAFHRNLRRHPKYTQSYLDHAYDIVHDFRKCDICVLHEIRPKEGEAVQDDKEKKVGEPDPTKKSIEIGSPNSNKTDSPSNKMVIGFPPTPDEMVYVEDDFLKYVHTSGPVDIGCDFEAVDELVLLNLTHSSFQYTDYFDLIHDFLKFLSM